MLAIVGPVVQGYDMGAQVVVSFFAIMGVVVLLLTSAYGHAMIHACSCHVEVL